MIRSVGHTSTHAWHRAHKSRWRRSLVLMSSILIASGTLVALGYFAGVDWSILGDALVRTTYRLLLAYTLALFIGTALALVVGWSPFSDTLFPVFDILQNIPSFALIPIFIFFFGFTDKMIVLFAVTSIIWPILFAVLTAINSAHADMNDAATIFGARRLRRILYYLAPLSFPAILTGSIVGVAIGWESVIGAEIIAGTSGFGAFIKDAGASGINSATIAGILAVLILVFVINRLIWAPLLSESARRYAE